MSFTKAIEHGKEHRKEYRGSKAIDKTCRNHGTCDYCRFNRLYSVRKEKEKMIYRITECNLNDVFKESRR